MKSITIKHITLHTISIPYVEPLMTSFGVEPDKVAILVELQTTEGITGWGEASVELAPGYGAETVGTAAHILEQFVIPRLIGKSIETPFQIPVLLNGVRGNNHAKSGVEAAVWDALARMNDLRLVDYFSTFLPDNHQTRGAATVGVSIGIQPSVEETLAIITKRLEQGYKRIKLKIKPGWDIELARGIREKYPDIMLMLDANSAYTLEDAEYLKQLDAFNLLMIEQPLGYDDIYEHSQLQPQLTTPVCLDESVKSVNDLKLALKVGACGILNLKPARVGGYVESLKIYQHCAAANTPLWIGGMLETGIGRAMNVALASLPAVTLPCDISATDRYFEHDIADPPFVLNPDSTISVPDEIGSGVTINPEVLQEAEERWKESFTYTHQ